jgi:hypothetical protein
LRVGGSLGCKLSWHCFFGYKLKEVVMALDTEKVKLSFPQRYWLLLCILVAIFSPIFVGWLNDAAHHTAYLQSIEARRVQGGSGGSSPSGGAVAPGDTSRPGSVNPMGPAVHTPANDSAGRQGR